LGRSFAEKLLGGKDQSSLGNERAWCLGFLQLQHFLDQAIEEPERKLHIMGEAEIHLRSRMDVDVDVEEEGGIECGNDMLGAAAVSVELGEKGKSLHNTVQTSSSLQCGNDAPPPMWTMLPKELIEKVFAYLPLHSLFQARTVCKLWLNMGFSNNLVKLQAEAPSCSPYFPVFFSKGSERGWCAYDHVMCQWLHLPPLTFLPCEAKCILAGDAGLLCLNQSVSGSTFSSLCVCNPMTKRWKVLPPLAHAWEPGITHMVVDPDQKAYKLIVTLTHCVESTHVFDSQQDCWQATSCLPPHFLLWGRRSSAFVRGFLYCVALEIGGLNMEGLIAYNVHTGVWTEVHELPRGMRDDPYVLSCGGRVLVVAAQKNPNGRLTSIRIVEFNLRTKKFVEVTEMPQNMMLEVFRCRGVWKPVAYGDKICVASKKTLQVAVYDMAQKTWYELPKCPLSPKVDVAPFCFGPSLQSLS
jgi:hypothetical protein